jgi:very-short-patch-repair endonuclease
VGGRPEARFRVPTRQRSAAQLQPQIGRLTACETRPVYHDLARELRKNLTEAERRLWRSLRMRRFGGCKFRRQAPIGEYIVDFVCFERKLVIELDGSQHRNMMTQDTDRTRWLNGEGFKVVRFWNPDIFNEIDSVLEAITLALDDPGRGQSDHRAPL